MSYFFINISFYTFLHISFLIFVFPHFCQCYCPVDHKFLSYMTCSQRTRGCTSILTRGWFLQHVYAKPLRLQITINVCRSQFTFADHKKLKKTVNSSVSSVLLGPTRWWNRPKMWNKTILFFSYHKQPQQPIL